MAWPIGTASPSCAMMRVRAPAYGAGTFMLALSVVILTIGSYFLTRSPTLTSHLPMTPLVTDSSTWGSCTMIGIMPEL